MQYRLDDRAARSRARVVAAVGTAQALSPAMLVVVLVHRLGYLTSTLALVGGGALVLLAVARGVAEYARVVRRLVRFAVTADDTGLHVVSGAADLVVAWEEVTAAREIGGALGGVRVETNDEGRIDVPRGGEGFGELRSEIAAHVPLGRARRRGLVARVVLGAAVILGMFFVPFAVDDLAGRSRVAAVLTVAVVWAILLAWRGRR